MGFMRQIIRSLDSKKGVDIVRLIGVASPISLKLAIKVQTILTECTVGISAVIIFLGLRGDLPAPLSILDRHSSVDTEFLNRLVFCVDIFAALVIGTGLLILLSLRGAARRYLIYVNIAIAAACWLIPPLGTA